MYLLVLVHLLPWMFHYIVHFPLLLSHVHCCFFLINHNILVLPFPIPCCLSNWFFCIQQHKDHDVLHEHEHKDHFHQMKNYNESNQLVLQFQSIELLVTHLQNPSFQMLVFDHFSSIDHPYLDS
uniref:Transmembrane protein n=1 Tax=Medicago truncatula TaxID=3880 RepID=I3TAE5_MEDTR|nr:unknown [Medicago truncatula]